MVSEKMQFAIRFKFNKGILNTVKTLAKMPTIKTLDVDLYFPSRLLQFSLPS